MIFIKKKYFFEFVIFIDSIKINMFKFNKLKYSVNRFIIIYKKWFLIKIENNVNINKGLNL